MTESEFLCQVLELARLRGWLVAHFRPGLDRRGRWRTAVQGDGAGFPDIVLSRDRLLFAELKTDTGKLRPEQEQWIAALQHAGQEVYLWRPADWPLIERTLE